MSKKIQKIKIFLFFLLMTELPAILTAQQYQLIWSDEFDSTAVNTNK
jgi:hypothetical protein